MNVDDIKKRVQEIEFTAWDYEKAHSMEDDLYLDLLHSIANNLCTDPVSCCKEALEVSKIDFNRLCA